MYTFFVSELDLVPYSLTFFLGLFVSVEVGMIAGTLTHLAILVYNASKPKVAIEEGKVKATNATKKQSVHVELLCPSG